MRAAIHELEQLVDRGMSATDFEMTRVAEEIPAALHRNDLAASGLAVDDRFYGLEDTGRLARFAGILDELTLEEVNAAIGSQRQYRDLKVAIVTGHAEALSEALASDAHNPVAYAAQPPQSVLDEDETIARPPPGIAQTDIHVVAVDAMFQRARR